MVNCLEHKQDFQDEPNPFLIDFFKFGSEDCRVFVSINPCLKSINVKIKLACKVFFKVACKV